ncbi:6-bladed beta-propeller [Maribellus sediminis]|uniref:6-bladed beta-propeller n=1 Tax=Maribellus sediminis TaxID=2696285 RepID=UPI001431A60F|nr:6-bladed beta-propeller [Maribellus sediminis]
MRVLSGYKIVLVLLLQVCSFFAGAQEIQVVQKHHSSNHFHIDLYKPYKNAKSYPLSTIAETIDYLPLETNASCLLKSDFINDITVTSKDIIITVYEDKCYHFNRQGKFLNVIGNRGKGPKEFTKLRSAVVDTLNQWVYVLDWDKLMKFDFDGNFLEKYNVEKNSLGMQSVMVQPGQILMGNGSYQFAEAGERFCAYVFSDKNKNLISKIACEKEDKIPFCVCNPSMYNYNNKTYFSDYWNDTIYCVKDRGYLQAYAVLDKGKFKYRSTEDKSITGGQNKGTENVIDINSMAESKRFIFITSNKGTFIYDKKTTEIRCATWIEKPNIWVTLENDINSVPFRILHNAPNTIQNDQLISLNDAYQFFEEGVENTSPKIKKLLENLQPDDNPILVFVSLKN